MGCFSSKHAIRSRSFRDDLSMSLQRRTVGIPGLEELFTTSKNGIGGGDDFLALLCTANTVAMKLKERDEKLRLMSEAEAQAEEDRLTSYESGADEPTTVGRGPEDHHQPGEEEDAKDDEVFHETINAWELMAGLEDADETDGERQAHEGALESPDTSGIHSTGSTKEQEVDGDNAGSCVEVKRSTPPVEDTPVDKQVISSNKVVDATPVTWGSPDDTPVDKNVQVENKPLLDNPTGRLKTITEIMPAEAGSSDSSDSPARLRKGLDYSLSFRFKGSLRREGDGEDDTRKEPAPTDPETAHKGVRRKAMAKDLKLLEVPAFEFKDIQLWIHGNEQALYDPDPYETPKFGNYIKSIAKARKEGAGELGALDPDLVAALQETIDGMTAEEECILKQFVEEFLDQVQSCGNSL